ncbi:SEC-C domain-containing protein [Shewanella sp. KX20019]|uniref:PBPRA1643 family SWIM/SEC-C metal-binding motif protein n=1 Tax=Shewanella sp. KX20019 TaxID=2803864 RepID=UPI0019296D80|nr:PBPRA1643 family SWIM/SEC-C metal-binding motif protein [Shewanella sp. KX20019]QQX82392.1 SEC-C domain-containing protein [Shewanella sp. KX20019]
MSDKFFFKGRKTPKPKHESYGFNTKRVAKLGTDVNPLVLSVQSEQRLKEINLLLSDNLLVGKVTIDASTEENVIDLMGILNKPVTTRFEKLPNRNEPCPCGSGKKYKKCCV